jgi:hypothetical protein
MRILLSLALLGGLGLVANAQTQAMAPAAAP